MRTSPLDRRPPTRNGSPAEKGSWARLRHLAMQNRVQWAFRASRTVFLRAHRAGYPLGALSTSNPAAIAISRWNRIRMAAGARHGARRAAPLHISMCAADAAMAAGPSTAAKSRLARHANASCCGAMTSDELRGWRGATRADRGIASAKMLPSDTAAHHSRQRSPLDARRHGGAPLATAHRPTARRWPVEEQAGSAAEASSNVERELKSAAKGARECPSGKENRRATENFFPCSGESSPRA